MTRETRPVTVANLSNYDTDWSVSHYGECMHGLFPVEAALIDEFWPAPPASVLDLGCGAARTTIALCARGYATIGIDLSATLLRHARQRYPDLDLRLMDATALTFPDRMFDAALFSYNGIDCVYPLEARQRCLADVFRVLKPGGVFLLSTHNAVGALFSGGYFYLRGHLNALKWLARQLRNPLLREWYWRYDDPGGTQHLYSAPPSYTITQAVTAGFKVVDIRGGTGQRHPGRIARREQHVHLVLRRPR